MSPFQCLGHKNIYKWLPSLIRVTYFCRGSCWRRRKPSFALASPPPPCLVGAGPLHRHFQYRISFPLDPPSSCLSFPPPVVVEDQCCWSLLGTPGLLDELLGSKKVYGITLINDWWMKFAIVVNCDFAYCQSNNKKSVCYNNTFDLCFRGFLM